VARPSIESDCHFLTEAYVLARECSPDPSSQNAALLVNHDGIVVASAVNRFPDGVDFLQERSVAPLKYHFFEHAERNVIYDAARRGVPTFGLAMYCPWAACSDCARAIIQAGIAVLVRHQCPGASNGKWTESLAMAERMLHEAGVVVRTISRKLDPSNTLSVRRSGELIFP